jgi:hypothetical protein
MSSIDYLRKRHEELLKAKADKEEKERLLAEIKELEEEGTIKSKIRGGLKSLRAKLHEKGQRLKNDGKKINKGFSGYNEGVGGWRPAIVDLANKSEFKAPKAKEAEWKPKIAKMVKK